LVKTDLESLYLAAYEKANDKQLDVDVCLLNLSDRPQVVEVMQGSYEADTDSFMDLGHSDYKTITRPPKGYHKIDHFDDEGQLDFTTWYSIRIGGRVLLEHFNGWSLFRDGSSEIPLLNVKGYLVALAKSASPTATTT
jgi:hypothetical protein